MYGLTFAGQAGYPLTLAKTKSPTLKESDFLPISCACYCQLFVWIVLAAYYYRSIAIDFYLRKIRNAVNGNANVLRSHDLFFFILIPDFDDLVFFTK